MKSHVLGLALLSAAAIVARVPAQAQNGTLTRSFVSSTGVDSNPCTIIQPCATFAHAYTMVGANGIVAALDPGKYGQLYITGPVTINGNGWAAITALGSGIGILIQAQASDNVTLKGLEIDGASGAAYGIQLDSAGNLVIENCNVQNVETGIMFSTGAVNFHIADTIVANTGTGIYFEPSDTAMNALGTFERVTILNAGYGIDLNAHYAAPSGTAKIVISNSTVSNNSSYGIYVDGSTVGVLDVTIDNTNVNDNGVGIYGADAAKILLGRSTITGNSDYGIDNETNPSTFYTYKDNKINLNGDNNLIGGQALSDLSYQ
jgi:Periplasmic copper-binding protein (NosD)